MPRTVTKRPFPTSSEWEQAGFGGFPTSHQNHQHFRESPNYITFSSAHALMYYILQSNARHFLVTSPFLIPNPVCNALCAFLIWYIQPSGHKHSSDIDILVCLLLEELMVTLSLFDKRQFTDSFGFLCLDSMHDNYICLHLSHTWTHLNLPVMLLSSFWQDADLLSGRTTISPAGFNMLKSIIMAYPQPRKKTSIEQVENQIQSSSTCFIKSIEQLQKCSWKCS